jgi:release factor H-coupled RctB family protein
MGTSLKVDGRAPVHIFASSKAWIEGNARQQLNHVAGLDGVTAVAAMPDLHAGKYGPVGSAILADCVYPQLAGSDIGCGMGLYRLDVAARSLRLDKLSDKLRVLEEPWDGDVTHKLREAGMKETAFDASLGSIGGGNHFCEVQAIEEVFAPDIASAAGLERDAAYVLVHSGSRGLGNAILEQHLPAGMVPLQETEPALGRYMAEHDHAVAWARLNRAIIAARAAAAAKSEAACITDVPHNFIEKVERGYLHRKGAAPATRGLVPVPGSRGTLSYLVQPLVHEEALASLAHGAGRKYERGSMHGRAGTKKSDIARLERNRFGGFVVCEDRNLLVEEAPEAYKNITQVIEDLVSFGLARVVASFRPLVTFKTARAKGANRDKMKPRERAARRDKEGWR